MKQVSRKELANRTRTRSNDGPMLPGEMGDAAMVDTLKVTMRKANRQLTIDKEIDDDVLNIVYQIEQWNREDDASEAALKDFVRPTITLFLHTPGGEVTAGMALVSAMEQSETPIMTICTGMAASMGFLIFISGHIRYAFRHAEFMLHQLSHGSWGRLMDMYETVLWDLKLQAKLDSIVIAKTKITSEQLSENRKCKTDWFMFAEEAVELGVADGVMALGLTVKKEDEPEPKPSLKGMKVGFTGAFPEMNLFKLAEEHGFIVASSTEDTLDVLVKGDGKSQDAVTKAEEGDNVTIITKDEFLDIITTPDESEEDDKEEVN